MSLNKIKYRCLNSFQYYAIFCAILKWIAMYRNIRNGVIVTVYIVVIIAAMLIQNKNVIDIRRRTTITVLLYVIYNIALAVIAYCKGYPFGVIFSELANSVIPILIYFIGVEFTETQAKKFELVVLITGFVALVSGVYYNVGLNDPYYIKFITETNPNFSLHGFTVYPRLNSFFGSVICGTLGCFGTAISFRFLEEKKKFKFCFSFVTSALLGILTLQRSAMVCVVFVSFSLMFWGSIRGYVKKEIPIAMAVIALVAFVIIKYKVPTIYNAVFDRINSISSAVSERSGGWNNAFGNSMASIIFGYGLATGGQRAIGISATTVNDGNYFKIIYECGIIGLMLFVIIVLQTLVVARKRKTFEALIYLIAICSCLLQMIGSNILTFQFTASLFWYLIGRINKCSDENIETLSRI